MSTIKVADIVRHPAKPEWGRGVVVGMVGHKIHVFFENLTGIEAKKFDTTKVILEQMEGERVPLLEHLRVKQSGMDFVLDTKRVGFKDLLVHFKEWCPGGFADERLFKEELSFKRAAQEAFQTHFGEGRGPALVATNDAGKLTAGFEATLGAQKILLSKFERAAFGDACQIADNVLVFAKGLFDYLNGPPAPVRFDRYVAALETVRPTGANPVTRWPILTLFPFLARPETDMFLKPEVTKDAADIIGFDLKYASALNGSTYAQLLMLAGIVDDELEKQGMRPRDHIETQSFIWVALKYP